MKPLYEIGDEIYFSGVNWEGKKTLEPRMGRIKEIRITAEEVEYITEESWPVMQDEAYKDIDKYFDMLKSRNGQMCTDLSDSRIVTLLGAVLSGFINSEISNDNTDEEISGYLKDRRFSTRARTEEAIKWALRL